MSEELIICDFQNSCLEWRNVDDIVMGGMSKSSMQIDEDAGHATFSGILSLDRNGGFASVRTVPLENDFKDYDSFRIRMKGDGRRYNFRVRNDGSHEGVVYGCGFDTVSGEWTEVELRFSEFLPLIMGKVVPDQAPMNPSGVNQICFLVAEQQKGAFSLQIDWIKAVRA